MHLVLISAQVAGCIQLTPFDLSEMGVLGKRICVAATPLPIPSLRKTKAVRRAKKGGMGEDNREGQGIKRILDTGLPTILKSFTPK